MALGVDPDEVEGFILLGEGCEQRYLSLRSRLFGLDEPHHTGLLEAIGCQLLRGVYFCDILAHRLYHWKNFSNGDFSQEHLQIVIA